MCIIHSKSLGVGKNTNANVKIQKRAELELIYAVDLIFFIDCFVPKMCYVLPTNLCNKSILAPKLATHM